MLNKVSPIVTITTSPLIGLTLIFSILSPVGEVIPIEILSGVTTYKKKFRRNNICRR